MGKSYAKEIIVGIVVTVIGGLVLAWLMGDGPLGGGNDLPLQSNQTSGNTNYVLETEDDVSQPIESSPAIPPTPRGVTNPSNPVPAGTTVLSGDYALTATGKIRTYDMNTATIYIDVGNIILQNISANTHIFRFQRSSFTLRDDVGNIYTPSDLDYSDWNEYYYQTVQLDIPSQKIITLESTQGVWVEKRIPAFIGPISIQAQRLFLIIDGFGPFPYLEIEITL